MNLSYVIGILLILRTFQFLDYGEHNWEMLAWLFIGLAFLWSGERQRLKELKK